MSERGMDSVSKEMLQGGRRCVVVGVGTLGEGIVKELLSGPNQVLALDIQPDRLENLASEGDLGRLGTQVVDFRDTDGTVEAIRNFGPVDQVYITVCPPRSHGGRHFWEEDRQRLKDFWELNVVAVGLFMHALIQEDSGILAKGAVIVPLSSGDGLEAVPAPYEVAHAGEARFVAGLTEALQVELNNARNEEGIRLTVPFPGPIIASDPEKDKDKPLDPIIGGGESSLEVARKIIKAAEKGQRKVITDWRVAAFAVLAPIISVFVTRERVEKFVYDQKQKIIEQTREKRSGSQNL